MGGWGWVKGRGSGSWGRVMGWPAAILKGKLDAWPAL